MKTWSIKNLQLRTASKLASAAFMLMAFVMLHPVAAFATNSSFVADQDATIDSQTKNATDNGNTLTVSYKKTGSAAPQVKWPLMEFDISIIPCGSSVSSASLSLYMLTAPGTSRTYSLNYWLNSTTWAESTATWDNTINIASNSDFTGILASLGTTPTGTTNNTSLLWNAALLANRIQTYLDSPSCSATKLLSFIVKDDGTDTSSTPIVSTFASKDNGAVVLANRPTLNIVWSNPPECSSGFTFTRSDATPIGYDDLKIVFTVEACTDLNSLKVQGGLGGNLTVDSADATDGTTGWPSTPGNPTDICQIVGQGHGQNSVCKWIFPDGLSEGNSATLTIQVEGVANYGHKFVCGYRPITSVWTASGTKYDNSPAGPLSTGPLWTVVPCPD